MSDMMGAGMPRPRPQGQMPQRRPQPQMRPGSQNMSIFNPTDMAAKAAMGDIRPNMTVGEFLQKNFGVSPDDPLQKLMQATQGQVQTRDMAGKLGVQRKPQGAVPRPGAPAPTQRPAPTGAPAGMPPGGGAPDLDSLISKL